MPWYNPSDERQRNWMLGGLVVLALIVPYWMYVREPRLDEIAGLETRKEGLDNNNRRAEAQIARGGIAELEATLALYERHVARLEELIPTSEQVPELLRDIQALARLRDVSVDVLTPLADSPQDAYTLQSYSMVVVGEYHPVGAFLADIATLPRIVQPVGLQLAPAAGTGGEDEFPVRASFQIRTYILSPSIDDPSSGALPAGGGLP